MFDSMLSKMYDGKNITHLELIMGIKIVDISQNEICRYVSSKMLSSLAQCSNLTKINLR